LSILGYFYIINIKLEITTMNMEQSEVKKENRKTGKVMSLMNLLQDRFQDIR